MSDAPHSVCLLVARWGPWPAWLPLLLRTYAANYDVRFTLLGDTPPSLPLPKNVAYAHWPAAALVERLARTVGFRAGALAFNNHSTSKISDLKPMFGEVFADLLAGCAPQRVPPIPGRQAQRACCQPAQPSTCRRLLGQRAGRRCPRPSSRLVPAQCLGCKRRLFSTSRATRLVWALYALPKQPRRQRPLPQIARRGAGAHICKYIYIYTYITYTVHKKQHMYICKYTYEFNSISSSRST